MAKLQVSKQSARHWISLIKTQHSHRLSNNTVADKSNGDANVVLFTMDRLVDSAIQEKLTVSHHDKLSSDSLCAAMPSILYYSSHLRSVYPILFRHVIIGIQMFQA